MLHRFYRCPLENVRDFGLRVRVEGLGLRV